MKIILFKKGFDSGAGGMPSPILPDGTLLYMPIPSGDKIKYFELKYNEKTYFALKRRNCKNKNILYCKKLYLYI